MAETTVDNNSIEMEVEQTLESTNLGHTINQNKNLILILGAILLAVIVGFSVYKSQAKKTLNMQAQAIYEFKVNAVEQLKEKKIDKEAFVAKLNEVDNKVKANAAYLSVALDASEALVEQNETVTAVAVLEGALQAMNGESYVSYLASYQLATLYEDVGRNDDAIATLEKLVASKNKILLAKNYFDLGRLYLIKGDFNQAKNNFNYVVTSFPKNKLANYANLYIKEIDERAKK